MPTGRADAGERGFHMLISGVGRRSAGAPSREGAPRGGAAQAALQPPCPLQAFWPLQACLSVLQPPCPLQAFWPLQACLSWAALSLFLPWSGASSANAVSVLPSRMPDTAAAMNGDLCMGVLPF